MDKIIPRILIMSFFTAFLCVFSQSKMIKLPTGEHLKYFEMYVNADIYDVNAQKTNLTFIDFGGKSIEYNLQVPNVFIDKNTGIEYKLLKRKTVYDSSYSNSVEYFDYALKIISAVDDIRKSGLKVQLESNNEYLFDNGYFAVSKYFKIQLGNNSLQRFLQNKSFMQNWDKQYEQYKIYLSKMPTITNKLVEYWKVHRIYKNRMPIAKYNSWIALTKQARILLKQSITNDIPIGLEPIKPVPNKAKITSDFADAVIVSRQVLGI